MRCLGPHLGRRPRGRRTTAPTSTQAAAIAGRFEPRMSTDEIVVDEIRASTARRQTKARADVAEIRFGFGEAATTGGVAISYGLVVIARLEIRPSWSRTMLR